MHRQQLRASKNNNSAYSAFNDDPTRIFVVVLPYQLQALKLVVLLQHVHSEFSIYLNFHLTFPDFPANPQVAILSMDWPEYLFKKMVRMSTPQHT